MPKKKDPGPHPTDRHVGARLRERRKLMGITQERVAEALELTFQQVQKYEKGTNRISASKLYDASRVLQVPVSYFFRDLEGDAAGEAEISSLYQSLVETPGGIELADAYLRAPRHLRLKVVDLLKAMAEGD